jgi:hypothetical protein
MSVRLASVAAALAALPVLPAAAGEVTTADLDRMMAVIERQQAEIDALRAEVVKLRETRTAAAASPPPAGPSKAAAPVVAAAAPAAAEAVPAEETAPSWTPGDGIVLVGGDGKPTVKLSGRINPAVNVADDGQTTDAYFVDNDVASTMLRLDGEIPLGDWRATGTLEVGFSPNNSYLVDQLTQSGADDVTVRRAEIGLRNDRFGRVLFGRGSGASDDAAEYDLSFVSRSIMYSGIADPVGGLFLTDRLGLTDTRIGDAFFNFDGDRYNRIRYDSPVFYGLQASASYGADDQWGVSINLGGDYGDWTGVSAGPFTLLGAAAVSDPAIEGVTLRYAGSLSVLHDPTGLSLTVSAGTDDVDEGPNPYNLYGKLGYQIAAFAFGETGFGIDYTYSENLTGPGDVGQSAGLSVLQNIERLGLDVYGQLRWYGVDGREGREFNDVTVGTIGAKFAF